MGNKLIHSTIVVPSDVEVEEKIILSEQTKQIQSHKISLLTAFFSMISGEYIVKSWKKMRIPLISSKASSIQT